jgi:hypothetical protein
MMQKLSETQHSPQAQIQSLRRANEQLILLLQELIETLTPFAETGKAVGDYRDEQMTMVGAQIPAKHFKKARVVLTKVEMDLKEWNL